MIGPYTGDNKRKAIVDFVKNPDAQAPEKKPQDEDGIWSKESYVVHLTGNEKTEGYLQHLINLPYALLLFRLVNA